LGLKILKKLISVASFKIYWFL